MITLIERAGEFSTKDIWHSTVQLITNNDDLHTYAATKVSFAFLTHPSFSTATHIHILLFFFVIHQFVHQKMRLQPYRQLDMAQDIHAPCNSGKAKLCVHVCHSRLTGWQVRQ